MLQADTYAAFSDTQVHSNSLFYYQIVANQEQDPETKAVVQSCSTLQVSRVFEFRTLNVVHDGVQVCLEIVKKWYQEATRFGALELLLQPTETEDHSQRLLQLAHQTSKINVRQKASSPRIQPEADWILWTLDKQRAH